MPDDPQGFDWSALIKSATPFAAALIPAAVGAIAGGKGMAGAGAAAGFAQGMRGQVESQEEYQKQLAQVQEANQRAAIAQQEQALRVQEFRIRAENLDRQNRLAEVQIPHFEALTKQENQKTRYYQVNEENQLKWAHENLQGARLASFLALDTKDRSDEIKRTEHERTQQEALPPLIESAIAHGMDRPSAMAIAKGDKPFDKLTNFITHSITEQKKAGSEKSVSFQASPFTIEIDGKQVPFAFNPKTNTLVPTQIAGGGEIAPKALTTPQEEALIAKRKADFIGVKPDHYSYPQKLAEWEGSTFQDAAVNIRDPKKYQERVNELKRADTVGMANAKKAYLSTPVGTPGISGKPSTAKPTEEGFREYIQTPQGREFLEGHKERVRAGAPAPRETEPGKPRETQAPSGTVLMQAPDGSQRSVPKDRVEEFKKKGAKIVGK